ncbi:LysR substrate-binding domain-containing protein [Vibrio astriarenae]|uniref:LysR substrate-binding domain-containing protein n=1 Tax=Vibrio astriarenae TaxID=1481923 RepID=UPI0037362706
MSRAEESSARKIPPFNSLRAFEAAARHQSLSSAARELNVSKSAVSQQIKVLEEFLEARLFERKGTCVELTEQAVNYLPLLTETLDNLNLGTQQLFGNNLRYTLNIRVAQSFCQSWLLPRIDDFRRKHPNINIRFHTTTNNYPNTNRSIDIEIINGYGNWGIKQAIKLTEQEVWSVVATRSFTEKYDFSSDVEIIGTYPKIQTFSYNEGWRDWFDMQSSGMPYTAPLMEFDSTHLALEATLQGTGMLLAKSILVDDLVRQGELVIAHPKHLVSKSHHYLIVNPLQEGQAKVEAFKSWLLDNF